MEFYYNLVTHQVEEGPQSRVEDRMGPYATREEAQRALETARERNESWDEENAAWDGGAAGSGA